MLVTTEGIVLKQRKTVNNRRMISVFTKKYGKISCGTSLNEKGRSKTAAALRPFAFGEYDIFRSGDSANINSAQLKQSFFSIGEDLDRFMTACTFIDYLDGILEEGQARPKLFEMTLEFLNAITGTSRNFNTILYAFIVKTLRVQGVMPELKCCVNCGKPLGDFGYRNAAGKLLHSFSISSGGVICEECIEREKSTGNSLIYSPSFDIIEVLQYLMDQPLDRFGRVGLKDTISQDIRRILGQYVSCYMGVDTLSDDVEWR